jgi:hypothetical protein
MFYDQLAILKSVDLWLEEKIKESNEMLETSGCHENTVGSYAKLELLEELRGILRPKISYSKIKIEDIEKLKIPIKEAMDIAIEKFCKVEYEKMQEHEKLCCEEENKGVQQYSQSEMKGLITLRQLY